LLLKQNFRLDFQEHRGNWGDLTEHFVVYIWNLIEKLTPY
jgi:hypothetical protein